MPETGDSTSWGSIPSIDQGAVISLFLVTLGTGLPVLFALLEGRTFYNSWYPWDSRDPMWFCVQFFSETFTAMFLTYFVVLFCYFYVKVIALICSQLEYLGDSLLELRQRTEELSGVNNVNKGWEILYELQQLSNSQVEQFPIPKHVEIRMQEELRKLIQHHNELYRFMNDVRDFYSTLFLVQFVAIGIDICFSLYVSLTTPVYDIEFFINNVVWIYQGPQLFFYCWLGTKLTETAYGVREAAYGSEWYRMPQSFKTCILTIMTRCDQKFKLTVGKFTTVSVETFITILQSIGSYMAVMSSLTQRDENPTAVTSTNSTVY